MSSFKYVRGSYARDARLKTQAARGNAPWLPKNFSDMVFEVLVPHSRAPGTRPPAEFPLSLGHYQPQVEPLGAFCAANASVGKIVAVASTPDILVNLDVLVRRVNQQLQAASRPPIPRPVNVTSANRMPYRCHVAVLLPALQRVLRRRPNRVRGGYPRASTHLFGARERRRSLATGHHPRGAARVVRAVHA